MPDVATGAAWTPFESALHQLAQAIRGDAPTPGSVAGQDIDLSPTPPAPAAPAPTWSAQRAFLQQPPPTSGQLPRGTSPGLFEQAMLATQGAVPFGLGPMDASDYTTPAGQQAATRAGGLGELATMLGPALAAVGFKAFHGSPADFNEFKFAENMGKGEGGQAYAHGGYFADAEPVAQEYKRGLSELAVKVGDTTYSAKDAMTDPVARAARALADHGGDVEAAKRDLWDASSASYTRDRADFLRQALRSVDEVVARGGAQKLTGHMYEVHINADPEHFLRWDKPLSQQSPEVQQAMTTLMTTHPELRQRIAHYTFTPEEMQDASGELIYTLLSEALGGRAGHAEGLASQALHEAGIPGVRYLDQFSRRDNQLPTEVTDAITAAGGDLEKGIDAYLAQRFPQGQSYSPQLGFRPVSAEQLAAYRQAYLDEARKPQTHNTVMFPGTEHLIEILKKYGIALPVAGAGAAYQQQQQSQPGAPTQ